MEVSSHEDSAGEFCSVGSIFSMKHWKNRSRPYGGLLKVFCWFVKNQNF